VPLI